MIEDYKNKYILTSGTRDLNNNGTDNYNPIIGLAGNHAYSILSFKELINVNGTYELINGLFGKKHID